MISNRKLKLLAVCLVVFSAAKLFFQELNAVTNKSISYKKHFTMTGSFWHRHGLSKLLALPDPQKNKMKLEYQKNSIHLKSLKMHTGSLRVVHLDLKGAAPKVRYFQQLFPLISSLGADGILMEYEDMFPYEGYLEVLRSPFAYSVREIEEIQNLASLHNLQLIPLVQVFGQLEFVLKHEQFFGLREVADFPNSLNPLAPGSFKLIKDMLTQVLRKHPEAQWIHIGANEVWGLGESKDSKNWLKQNNQSVETLFLNHVMQVCHFLAKLRPEIEPIFWEDMLRKISAKVIKESGISSLVSPMIWKYDSNLDLSQIGKLLSNYEQAGFQTVWFASAFKGASGIGQRWTPLNQHLANHLAWLKVIASMPNYSIKLGGIALTGWQRYGHHTVLCELLPVAIPSLAICLETLKYGSYNLTVETEVQEQLGCSVDLQANSCKGKGSFAGSEIYYMIQKIHNELQTSTERITKSYQPRGFKPFQRKSNFANQWNITSFKEKLTKMLNLWDKYMELFQKEMLIVYFPDTVEEWMEENINQYMDKLHSLANDTERIIKLNGKPKS